MHVMILGAGTVGTWVADILCRQGHSVTVVDQNAENVRRINAELDVRAVQGNASQSTVLFQCGVAASDICLALTGEDEVNIVAASMAKALGARRTVARVYAPAFRDLSTFDYQRHFGIDRLLSLEQLSATELARTIRNPGAIPLENFARGQLVVYEIEVAASAPAVGTKLSDLKLPSGVRVGSISRENRMWIASAGDEPRAGDQISLIGMPGDVADAHDLFDREKRFPRKQVIMIAGGGETGYHLAQSLGEHHFHVILLEKDAERCDYLSTQLKNITVLHASANRRMILEDEGAGKADWFVACTGNDENNIMACVEARELGAKHVLSVVGRADYANVVEKLGIDLAVSERDVAARQILGHLHEGSVISHSKLPNGSIGVYELEILENSEVSGKPLCDLPLSGNCLVAAIDRDGFVKVPKASDQLIPGDIVVALIDETVSQETLKLFQA
ncbi:Trk system potassium uptake protein TrkA [Roseimaritima multifibrata]|uniref:Trk system potassium uptake protein TrkA n=1 Tax=Roseimaritima multifibrata TaxID=1930274 RepID=A0A517MA87_9BACT|nr:Trk system potassium transporter TrkA [Roseimaritima multifibrata]QDS91795.1 Trk system potassium uptake protein TrkA [Roseimaritima multifibrata]